MVAVVVLAASACGSNGATSAETSSSEVAEEVEASDTGTEDDAGDESADEKAEDSGDSDSSSTSDPWADYTSPIQEFLGVDYSNFDSDESQAHFAEQEREAQESIAVCMRELGWEYTPVDNSQFVGGFDPFAADGLEWGSDEWVEKYGFGITTQSFPQSQVGPDLIGFDDSEMFGPGGEGDGFEDPNQPYVESLSQAEQEAYYSDLYGDGPEFDETLTEEEQQELFENFEPTGCQSEAYNDGFGFGNEVEQQFYEEFGDQLDDLYERVGSDPRIVAEQQKLTDCLAESGHTLTPDKDVWQQAYEMFEQEMEPLYNAAFSDPFEGLDPESMTEEEINEILDAMPASGPEFTAEQKAVLGELQAEEKKLANDVLACEPGFFTGAGQSDIFFEVLAEYEQAFLDENAGALSSFEGAGAE